MNGKCYFSILKTARVASFNVNVPLYQLLPRYSVPFAAVVLKCNGSRYCCLFVDYGKSQRNRKLRACIVKLYEKYGAASVAFICP